MPARNMFSAKATMAIAPIEVGVSKEIGQLTQ